MLCEEQSLGSAPLFSQGLNPCSNGRCSARALLLFLFKQVLSCLNPCSNGRCSASKQALLEMGATLTVLILVLMEDALRVCHSMTKCIKEQGS